MNWKKTDSICGTSLQGNVNCSYQDLVSIFGEQHSSGDDYKTSCEWGIEFDDGIIATIYDWKQNKIYLGEDEGIHYTEVTNWNIGGNSWKSHFYIYMLLETKENKIDKLHKDAIALD
tara:strand:+ start:104 stop:454 length:351 start_codon:yes stop_codon:yes gene_type:complete